MDSKWIVISVITAMAAVVMFASTAAAIVVDGNGDDWDPSWFLASDSSDPVCYGSAGYNLTGVWQHYNATEDTLYFMYNVTGIAGDSNGDGDPNKPDNGALYGDQYGVGDMEKYRLLINTSSTGDPLNSWDVMLTFTNNSATVAGPKADMVSSTEAAINTTESCYTPFVEFSVGNVSGWMANPYKYSLCGWVGSEMDVIYGEDWLDEIIRVSFPPVANFTFVAGDCNQTVWFDPSGSYDDPYGGIVNYTWNFDDGTGEVRLDNSSFTHLFPVSRGSYNVSLTVTDNNSLTDTLVREVLVNRVPAISPVTASKTSVAEPGEWVLFEGWYSDPDGDTLTHRWFIDGVEIANGSSTTYSNVSYFVDRSLTANLTIEDPHNCTDTDNVTVTYWHLPVPVINFTATGCLEVELNASESYDPDGVITNWWWDTDNDGEYDDGTGVTCIFSPVSVPPDKYWIRLMVTDDAGVSNTTRKQVSLTGDPVADAKADGSNGPVQIIGGGRTVTFCGNESHHPYSDDGADIVSYNWTILDAAYSTTDPDECFDVFVNETTTAYLRVVDNYGCEHTDSVHLEKVPPVHEDVPVLTPAGMLALIGMLCIIGVGRIAKKGREL